MSNIQQPSVGTTLKLTCSIDANPHCTLDSMDFTATYYNQRGKSVTFAKDDMIRMDENCYFAVIDSEQLGRGAVYLHLQGRYQDTDCPDGWAKVSQRTTEPCITIVS